MFHYGAFRDTTEHLNDGETLRTRLAEDGYLFLRGLLPREAILDVRAQLLKRAMEGGWLALDSPVAAGVANSTAAYKDPEPRYMSVFRGLWSDEALHRLRIDPRVIALFDRIFGERTLAHPMFVQRNIFPQADGFDFTTGIHQDRVHIGGATSYAMWMPLGDCPREMGISGGRGGVPHHGRSADQGRFGCGRHGYRRADPGHLGHRRLRGGRCSGLPGRDGAQGTAEPRLGRSGCHSTLGIRSSVSRWRM